MTHVESPEDGPFDLGAALATHLLGIGVLPQIVDVARKSTVT